MLSMFNSYQTDVNGRTAWKSQGHLSTQSRNFNDRQQQQEDLNISLFTNVVERPRTSACEGSSLKHLS